jgi:hypothetical protein
VAAAVKLLDRLRAHFKSTPPAVTEPPAEPAKPEIVHLERYVAIIENQWTHRNEDGTGAFTKVTHVVAGVDATVPLSEVHHRLWKALTGERF